MHDASARKAVQFEEDMCTAMQTADEQRLWFGCDGVEVVHVCDAPLQLIFLDHYLHAVYRGIEL